MQTLHDLILKDKRVLVRFDLNSPVENGKITDDTRLRESIPTLQYLLEKHAKQIIILAHQGRPEEITDELRLDPHAKRLSELLGEKILKLDDCGETPPPEKAKIVMLENVRFYPETDKSQSIRDDFARSIAQYGDVYVNDAFACSHRDHATITSLPKLVSEKCAGLLLEREIAGLQPLLGKYREPLVLIMGGSKIDTKIGVLKNYLEKADTFLIGGALANTFLAAQNKEVGQSLYEKDKLDMARKILTAAESLGKSILLPIDIVAATDPQATPRTLALENLTLDLAIYDIGPETLHAWEPLIANAGTIIWNGPVGYNEVAEFAKGTHALAEKISVSQAYSVIGGGDTLAALEEDHALKFGHISTGGGAMLEYLEGIALPGISALE